MFYSKPQNFEELAATVIDRVINLAEIKHNHYTQENNKFIIFMLS